MEKRICAYRNCNVDISEMRKDAKFCSRNCKSCERKYKKRKEIFIEKYSQLELKKVEEYKKIKKMFENSTF